MRDDGDRERLFMNSKTNEQTYIQMYISSPPITGTGDVKKYEQGRRRSMLLT